MFCRPVSPEFIISAGLGPVHPGPAIPHSTCFHESRYVRAGPSSHASLLVWHMGAGCRGLLSPLGDLATLTRGNLQPPRQLYPHQVWTLMELAFSGYHCMIVTTTLDPPHELTQFLQFDASDFMEVLFHVGHIKEGVVFLDVLPLLLVLGEMIEEPGLQIIPFHLLERGAIVLVIGLEDMIKVLPPSGALILSNVLQRVFRWGPHTTATLGRGASRCGSWRDIVRHPRGVPTHLTRCLLTDRPDRGPLLHSPGATGRPAVIVSASNTLPSVHISVLTTSGNRFGGGVVKGDSQS